MAGLWLFPLILLAKSLAPSIVLVAAFSVFTVLLSGAHSLGPTLTVWCDQSLRQQLLRDKTYLITFALIVLFSVPLGVYAATTLSAQTFLFLASIYYIASTWHLAAQNFGVLSIYRLKSGESSPVRRQMDFWLCSIHGCFLFPAIWAFTGLRQGSVLEPGTLAIVSNYRWVLEGLVAAFAVVGLTYSIRTRSAPRFLYMTMLSVQALIGLHSNLLMHALIMYVNHWMAELALLSIVNGYSVKRAEPAIKFSLKKYVLAAAVLFGIGIFGETILNDRSAFFVLEFRPQVFISLLQQTGMYHWMGAFLGLGLAIRLSHILFDRFIFSSRSPARARFLHFLHERPLRAVDPVVLRALVPDAPAALRHRYTRSAGSQR